MIRLMWLLLLTVGCSSKTLDAPEIIAPDSVSPTEKVVIAVRANTGATVRYWWSLDHNARPELTSFEFAQDPDGDDLDGERWTVIVVQEEDGVQSGPAHAVICIESEQTNFCRDDADPDADGDDTGSSAIDADGDGYGGDFDCDDTDASIYPGADEVCDDKDNDCDDEIDEDAIDRETYYEDLDGDGYGGPTEVLVCERPDGYTDEAADCNDDDASIYPGAGEICDEVDNDCDDEVDEDAIDATTWYEDYDGDGFGGTDWYEVACVEPTDALYTTYDMAADCNDDDASIHPDATEVCDGVDNNCIDGIDEGFTLTTWYLDSDGDGYGSDEEISACSAPIGYVDNGDDCDDSLVYPLALHISEDEDCDGWPDGSDCGPSDPDIHPGVTETWYDGVDSDCITTSDYDADDDGHDHDEHGGDDCNDDDPDIYPGATDTWYDGVDSDCAGDHDWDADGDAFYYGYTGAPDCDDHDGLSTTTTTDADCDGTETAMDCDDEDPVSTIRFEDYDCDGVLTDDDCDDDDPERAEGCGLGESFETIGDAATVTIDAAEFVADYWYDTALPEPLAFGELSMLLSDSDSDSNYIAKAEPDGIDTPYVQDFCEPTLELIEDSDGAFKAAGAPVDIGYEVVSTTLDLSTDPPTIAFKVDAADMYSVEALREFAMTLMGTGVSCCVMDADGCEYGTAVGYCGYIEFPLTEIEPETPLVIIPEGVCHPSCDGCDPWTTVFSEDLTSTPTGAVSTGGGVYTHGGRLCWRQTGDQKITIPTGIGSATEELVSVDVYSTSPNSPVLRIGGDDIDTPGSGTFIQATMHGDHYEMSVNGYVDAESFDVMVEDSELDDWFYGYWTHLEFQYRPETGTFTYRVNGEEKVSADVDTAVLDASNILLGSSGGSHTCWSNLSVKQMD